MSARFIVIAALAVLVWIPRAAVEHRVPVRNREGSFHGFLVGRTADGRQIAAGDDIQTVNGDQVTNDLALTFTDGSEQRETVVFEQQQYFRVISDHLLQHGPTFPQSLDWALDASGHVHVVDTDGHGAQKVADTHVDADPALANGIISTIMQNARPEELPLRLPIIAPTTDARRVTLVVSAAGEDRVMIGGVARTAARYTIHVDIGGVAGFIAPIIGRQPPDSQVWILRGTVSTFLKSNEPLYDGGPMWTMALVGIR